MLTATATNSNSNIDDILAVARKFPRRDRELAFIMPFSVGNANGPELQNSLLSG